MLLLQGRCGFDDVDAVDAGLAVYLLGSEQLTNHGAVAAGEDPHIAVPGDIAHQPHVALRQVEGDVPRDSRNTQYLEFLGRCHRQEQRDRIVLARIAIDDDALPRHRLRT